jgi:hypothetical protein
MGCFIIGLGLQSESPLGRPTATRGKYGRLRSSGSWVDELLMTIAKSKFVDIFGTQGGLYSDIGQDSRER